MIPLQERYRYCNGSQELKGHYCNIYLIGVYKCKWNNDIGGLAQERRNCIATALDLRLSCTKQSAWVERFQVLCTGCCLSDLAFDGDSLQWRHNGLDSVSNHQPYHCLLSRLFGRRSKKTSKLRVPGLCAWNSPGTGEFPAQMASYAKNVSIWWRHHVRIIKLNVVVLPSCLWWRVFHKMRLYCYASWYNLFDIVIVLLLSNGLTIVDQIIHHPSL